MEKPEEKARQEIDQALAAAGWKVQSLSELNIHAGRGVAVREFPLQRGHGFADYLLYVNGKAVGAVEAKKKGETLTGVEVQTEKYSLGLPPSVPAHQRPLPFLYQSTSVETRFTNMLDPEPRSRRVFHFHQPETFVNWLETSPITIERSGKTVTLPSTLRRRLQMLPTLGTQGLWPAQHKAVANLEKSLREDRPRALIQMATGSGKTFTVWVVLPNKEVCEATLITPSSLINPNKHTLKTVAKARAYERQLVRNFEFVAQSNVRGESTEDRIARLIEMEDAVGGESTDAQAGIQRRLRLDHETANHVHTLNQTTAFDISAVEIDNSIFVDLTSGEVKEFDDE